MTQDEIIEMAAEIWNAGSSFPIPSSDDILHFAKLVAAKERSACEKVAADFAENMRGMAQWGANEVFKAIRARWQA